MDTKELIEKLENARPNTVMGLVGKDGQMLMDIIKDYNVKTIVETGVCFGYSSAYFLHAMVDGVLVSIEPYMKARKDMVVPKEFDKNWFPIQSFPDNILDKILKKFSPVDMFFHDGDHRYEPMMAEFMIAVENGVRIIASDDVGGPLAGTVWVDFLSKSGYKEIARGVRCRVAIKYSYE